MVDQYVPTKGLTLYIDPKVSVTDLDYNANVANISNIVQEGVDGVVTLSPSGVYVNASVDNFFRAGYGGSSFDAQSTSTNDMKLTFNTGPGGSACAPAFTSANQSGTLMMWLYVSDANVDESFLIGLGNNCAFSIETNAANTQWRLKGAGGLETSSDDLGPQWSNSVYDQRSTRYSDYYACNQWHCIVYSIYPIADHRGDITTHSAQLFVNDEIDSHVGAFEDTYTSQPHDNGVDFQIVEMFKSSTSFLQPFRGRVGQIAVWDRRPSDYEISSLYNKFKYRYGV